MKHLFIGLNTIDLQFLVERYPEENTKVKSSKNIVTAGGPATNAAVACAYLSGEATLISPVGKHEFHTFITNDLHNYGVELIDPLDGIPTEPIFASIINSAENGSRTVYSYFPIKNGTVHANPKDLSSDTILFDGFYPYMTKEILQQQVLENATVVFDGGSWKEGLEELIPFIDIAICSEHFRPPGGESLMDVFEFFSKRGVNKVAITQGDKPVIIKVSGEFFEVSVPKIEAVDTLGAGDFFHGAFCYYYGLSGSFNISIQKASEIAAKSCTVFGTRDWMR